MELPGYLQFIYLVVVVAIDIVVNWYVIEIQLRRPNHTINWCVRALVIVPSLYVLPYGTWFYHCVNAMFIYLFLFDLGLNLTRDKTPWYLGDAKLDRLQKKYLHEFPSFCFKAIIFLFCSCYMISNYNS